MGLLLKIFIPLLGVALAFYFYSAPENFSEGKSLKKHALKPRSGRVVPEWQCVPMQKSSGHERPFKAQLEEPRRRRAEHPEGKRRQPRCKGSEHPVSCRKAHGITLGSADMHGKCLISANDLFGKHAAIHLKHLIVLLVNSCHFQKPLLGRAGC